VRNRRLGILSTELPKWTGNPTMIEAVQEIRYHLSESFGDIQAPNYAKVSARLDARSTWPELSSIIQIFWVKDVTDVNYDISMGLLLKDGVDEFKLELSAVGPYATIMKSRRDKCYLMSLDEIMADARLVSALASTMQSRTFLSRSVMETEVPFGADEAGPVSPRVYNALFSDIEILPWETLNRVG
jgi:hypothetical protein